jgi:oligosaccharide repeat unit polymerase
MRKSGRDHRAILGCHVVFTLLSGILIPLLSYTTGEPEKGLYAYCVFTSVAAVWALWSWIRVTGTLFDLYGLFLVAVLLFNMSHSVLYAVGLAPRGVFDRFGIETCLQAAGAATLGIMSMHFGALILSGTHDSRFRAGANSHASPLRGPSLVGGMVVTIALIPAAVETSTALAFSMSHSYGASHLEASAVGFDAWSHVLAAFLLPGSFYFLVGRPSARGRQLLLLACVTTTALTFFFVGDRSDGTMALVAALWLYDKTVKKVSFTFLAVVATALLVIFPVIFITRGLTGDERLSADVWVNALSKIDSPVQSSVVEMGGSLGVLAHVINLVPAARGFDFGMSYLSALRSIFPNFSGGLHPSAQRSLSMWLVSTIDPYIAAHGGGMGFSVLAEAYLNFGWFGIVVIMWTIGAVFSRVTRWPDTTHDPAALAAVACMMMFAPKFARAECLEVVRAFVWYTVGLYSVCCFVQRKQLRHKPTAPFVLARRRWLDLQAPPTVPFSGKR